jgi:ABC-type Fe3+/spermidine/putrescine transport system ATPase subunit
LLTCVRPALPSDRPAEEAAPLLRLVGLGKSYGDAAPVVQDLDLSLRQGEFLSLLGPSGCGKTSTLRMIAGLEQPSAGRILLGGRDITADPAHRRPVNTVFQDYALFPHLSVAGNVGFGLSTQRRKRTEIDRRVAEMLAMVGLSAQAGLRPATLSGGQRQRVALARALARQPELLLLDEPLSALDAQLRQQMQAELRALQRRLGSSFLLVTHDQDEALSMSDRIAVMHRGRIVQIDRPEILYDRPRTAFVARFLGATNLLPASAEPGGVRLAGSGAWLALPDHPGCRPGAAQAASGMAACLLAIRPEHVALAQPGETANVVSATLERCLFQGGRHRLEARLSDGTPILADLRRDGAPAPQPGTSLRLVLPPARLALLPPEA